MRRLAILGVAALLGSASSESLGAARAILRVPGDYATIQTAIDAASAGDTVMISPGAYAGGLAVGKSLTLVASDEKDPAATVINSGNPMLQITANDVKIQGLTFQGGGKALVHQGQGLQLLHCRFVQNGGDQVSFEEASGVVRDCYFEGAGDDGIDIDGSSGDITLENNTILRARDDGIEERLYKTKGAVTHRITMRNNFISGAKEDGIQLIDYPGASNRVLRLERNTIVLSAMAGIGSMAGGNTKENYAGAPMEEKVYVLNNTLIGNNHGITGGHQMIVLNNIISSSPGVGVKRAAAGSRIAYNCFWNNGTDLADSVAATDTLRADPNLDAAYRLQPGSPCIDAGSASISWNGELVAAPGPAHGAPDLGAHEAGASDLPTVTVQSTGVAAEPSSRGLFTIARSGAAAAPLVVKYAVGGTAASATDYLPLAGTAIFPAGSASITVPVIPVDDKVVESEESIVLTLTADASYAVGTPSTATIRLADDDSPLPTVTIAATDAEAKERGREPAVFTVMRTGSTVAALVVTFAVAGDASNGVDYEKIGTSVTIPAGSATATITIIPIDDALPEEEEVDLTLVPSPAYTVGTPGGASITITDDDGARR